MVKKIFALLSVILFWGYETSNITFSIIILIFLISPFLLKSKLKFSFNLFKFASLISYLLLFIVIYYYINNNMIFFLSGVLKWAPLIILPIITLEIYSENQKTPTRALILFSENNKVKTSVFYYYILISVLSTSSGKTDIIFYIFIAVFFAILLFQIKPKRYSFITWIFSFLLLMSSSFIVQNGISDLHKKAIDSVVNFLMGIDNNNFDISKSRTRIGSIGDLKLSNKIMYRLKADKEQYPQYLREATYTKYFDGDWVAPKSKFFNFKDSLCVKVAPLLSEGEANKGILNAELIGEFKKQSTLPLPTRSINIMQNSNEIFSKNKLMVLRREGLETNSIKFRYHKYKISCDKKMDVNDLRVPKNELKYIKLFIKENNLKSNTPVVELLKKLNSIFYTKFKYSLNLKESDKIKSPLGNFLLESKAGHCEYYATATTLILRELGIPARYTVGYAVLEYSNFGDFFIIRQRHAHAWVRVLVNAQWYNYDTTPPDWNAIETSNFSIFYKISDLLSHLEYKFTSSTVWKYVKKNLEYFIGILILVFIIIRYKNRNKRKKEKKNIYRKNKFLKKIDKVLKKKNIIRNKELPIEIWLNGLSDIERDMLGYNELSEIISQYYIYRFSDKNLPKSRLKNIYKEIKKWKNRK